MTTKQYLEFLKKKDKLKSVAIRTHIRFLFAAIFSFVSILVCVNCYVNVSTWFYLIPAVCIFFAVVPWFLILRPWYLDPDKF